jgi:hypothetical protein
MIVVPRLPEFRVADLLEQVANHPQVAKCLPDLKDADGKLKTNMNRQYLFNVINSRLPSFFSKNMINIM